MGIDGVGKGRGYTYLSIGTGSAHMVYLAPAVVLGQVLIKKIFSYLLFYSHILKN